MSGKGSARRPGSIPEGAWDAIFKPKPPPPFCNLCKMTADKCGCVPTDDGPGQVNDAVKMVCQKCGVDRLQEPCKIKDSCTMIAAAYERRRFNREGV